MCVGGAILMRYYLRAADQGGDSDLSPANWTFTVIKVIDEPPIAREPIPPENENDTGKGIIGEALRLAFIMFGDRVSARSLTALSR
jgi:hypothetical protein